MTVPKIQFTPTGLVLPPDSSILAGVQGDYNDAFGGNLNPALETPQGQLASSQAAIISDANALFAEFVNQVNPDVASGFMQDAIGRIYFLNRTPGAPTSVLCDCGGDFGTLIPTGAQAQDTSGNRYICTLGGTIPFSGSISLPFACIVDGPTPCPANTVTRIYQGIPGWDSVNNPLPGVPGRLVESQAEFAYRRQQSVALNGHGSLNSVYGAVFQVPDVVDVYATENKTSATVLVGATNYPLLPHSLYVAAVGGDPTAIAQAIWTKKDTGCNTNGNTTIIVKDDSGYAFPQPQYPITYQIPASLPIKFAVQLADSDDLPVDIVARVRTAIIATFRGADGGERVRIGSLLLASKFYKGVTAIGPTVSVLSILLGSSTPTLTSQLIGIDQAPTVDAGDISVILV